MTAATAAAKWLAARRLISRSSMRSPFGQSDRLVLFAPALLSGAVILCAAIGFAVTQLSASHIAAQEHAALQRALDAFQGATGDVQDINDTELRLIEHSAGLKDLRFDVGPANEAGREMQSLHDARGRIIGWFSWIADNALAHAMDRLWGLLAVVGAVFGVVSFLAAWVSQRPPRSLDRRAATARKPIGHDALTGLPNQRAMIEHLDDALAQRRLGSVVFILVDLDGFHEVNDALGRAGGDAVMMNVAEHLRTGLPAGAMLGRFEEDEFAVVATGDDRRTAAAVVDTLRASLQRPIFVDRMWQITAGVGVAEAPEDGTTSDELARRAGLALRAAKREGRGRLRLFEPQIETEYAERRSLLRELQSAISLQTFDVHYQPIVAADGGAMVGVEALLRWSHPSRGPIPPAVFIPLAEQSGLMSQLGEIVLRRALADASRWPALSVAVNLSPLQIRDRWLVDLVGTVMSETGIASSRVVLEVTEGILIDNPQEALDPARSAARARREPRARRFRHRLFEPQLSAKISLRPAQDRSRLRCFAWLVRQYRSDHPGDRDFGPCARHESAGGRR